jgi:hypothetical protein
MKTGQSSFDFDDQEPQPEPPAREPSSVFFAPTPTDDRELIMLQIARDMDTLRQEDHLVAPDRNFYIERLAALRSLLT